MKLNIRQPIIVIVGSWNPAIFSPPWIAQHLFNIPLNQLFECVEVIEPSDQGERLITYFDHIGLSVEPNRLSLFVNSDEFESNVKKLEDVCAKILGILPHTPMGAYGINFNFIVNDASELLLDSFSNLDPIRSDFHLINEVSTLALEFEPTTVLNLKKSTFNESYIINFNFHHQKLIPDRGIEGGRVAELFSISQRILRDTYKINVTNFEILRHKVPNAAKIQ